METTRRVSAHLVFVIIDAVAAALTLLPLGMASKACRLGYKALCSFTPISTALLLTLLVMHVILHRKESASR